MQPTSEKKRTIFSRLPSFVWILIILGGLVALIGGIIALFAGLSSIEGLASIILLAILIVVVRLLSNVDTASGSSGTGAWGGLITGAGLFFFAVMGLAIDQPGNVIYNLPLQMLYCPQNAHLSRGIEVSHYKPGSTTISQDFTCVGVEGNVIKQLGDGELILVRFFEYVVVGYLAIGMNKLYNKMQRRTRLHEN